MVVKWRLEVRGQGMDCAGPHMCSMHIAEHAERIWVLLRNSLILVSDSLGSSQAQPQPPTSMQRLMMPTF